MFGLFNLFGRAAELKALDEALRGAGLHPQTVPEAVKLTTVRLLKAQPGTGSSLPQAAYDDAARLLGYCMLGHNQFIAGTTLAEAARAEARLDAAIAAGDSLDARLVLLALHAGVIAAEVAERFEVETE